MHWLGLIPLVGVLACARAPTARDVTAVHRAQTARDLALDTPCDLAAAILGVGLPAGRGPKQARWHAAVDASCGSGRLSRMPVFLGLEPEERELLGWETTCPNGLIGPHLVPGGTMDFYDVEVTVRDAATLTFKVTPRYVEFDPKGHKLHDVVQGCAELSGMVSPGPG
jgi:hypothetical protein